MAIVDSLLVRPFRAEPFLSGQFRPVRSILGLRADDECEGKYERGERSKRKSHKNLLEHCFADVASKSATYSATRNLRFNDPFQPIAFNDGSSSYTGDPR
jgi:hypothetical protein